MIRVLLLTHWAGGDVFPFIKLAKKLVKTGFEVVLFTHCIYEKYLIGTNVTFVAIDNLSEYENMNKDLALLNDPVHEKKSTIDFVNTHHDCEHLLKEYNLMAKYIKKDKTVILARHRSSIAGQLLAEKENIAYSSVVLAPNYFAHMNLHNQLFGNEMCIEINKARTKLGLEKINDWKKWLYKASYIGVWPDWFAKKDIDWPSNVELIGYIDEEKSEKEELQDELVEFLNKHKKVILITGGTSTLLDGNFYKVTCKATNILNYPTIAVIKHKEHMPSVRYDNIFYTDSVCMDKLLDYVSVIIHHGGMGTLSEATFRGIPQIILAHMVDRPDNAYRIKSKNVALVYPPKDWESDILASGIKEALTDVFKARCSNFAKYLNQEDAFDYKNFISNMLDNDIYRITYTKEDKKATVANKNKLNAKSIYMLLNQKKEKE